MLEWVGQFILTFSQWRPLTHSESVVLVSPKLPHTAVIVYCTTPLDLRCNLVNAVGHPLSKLCAVILGDSSVIAMFTRDVHRLQRRVSKTSKF